MGRKRDTQNAWVRKRLLSGRRLTQQAADERGIRRLAARIYDLKAEGIPIETEFVRTRSGARIARYEVPLDFRRALQA